ncbi:tyrosine-protein phosphatase [Thalassobacillus sp. CUG 92003]|uniref:tyrosine-protein phosphatase n=1 Tax=Thalassobacillus sp. CUG 92003 TaxID=2736641 RepID=UPI0015E7A9E9|nr:CpsB/CapC family capsule biosynthesis tyrosine phosphatase [Thalassobacillus sp. CUG 92003]
MIDTHCHILHGMEEGPAHLQESVEMLRQAVDEGIHIIMATPRANGTYDIQADEIDQRLDELIEAINEENLDITVKPGNLSILSGDILENYQQGLLKPLNENGRYVLIEFPPDHIPSYTTNLLFNMQVSGYTPIIAHPEQNSALREHPDLLYTFVKNGAVTQIGAPSLMKKHGKKVEKFSYQMIEHNLAHLIASEARNSSDHTFLLREAYEQLENTFGKETRYEFLENAERVYSNEECIQYQPEVIRRKKRFGIF